MCVCVCVCTVYTSGGGLQLVSLRDSDEKLRKAAGTSHYSCRERPLIVKMREMRDLMRTSVRQGRES